MSSVGSTSSSHSVEARFAFWRGWLIPCTDASWATFAWRADERSLRLWMRPFAAHRRWIPIGVVAAALVIATWTLRPVLGLSRLDLLALAVVAATWIVSRLFPGLARAVVVDDHALRVRDAHRFGLWTFASCDLRDVVSVRATGDLVRVERRAGGDLILPLGPLSSSDAALIADVLRERLERRRSAS